MDPPPANGCNVVEGPAQNVAFTTDPVSHDYSLDEDCSVTSVSATQIVLDCPTYPITIDLDLAEAWTPTFADGATLHLRAEADDTDWWELDWRLDHPDETLALAGRHAFYYSHSTVDLGLGAIPFSVVDDACVADCSGDIAVLDVGLMFAIDGATATLFTGAHETLADYDVWVTDAWHHRCNELDEVPGHLGIFVSAPAPTP